MRKRHRKKLPGPERQPLIRPEQPYQVWSMDFVFDELTNGRRVKTLTIVDDCSKESIRLVADTSIPAACVARTLDVIKAERGLPKTIRTDNGPEFAGRTLQDWAARNGVELRHIQPGKPVQNATSRASTAASATSACRNTGLSIWATCAASWRTGGRTTTTINRIAH